MNEFFHMSLQALTTDDDSAERQFDAIIQLK